MGYVGVEVDSLHWFSEGGTDIIIRARQMEALEGKWLCRLRAVREYVRAHFALPHPMEVYGEQARARGCFRTL